MWSAIKKHFADYPAQEKVAKLLLSQGLSVREGKIFSKTLEIPDKRIAGSLGVDRRVVNSTIQTIQKSKELSPIFSALSPIPLFKDIAPHMGWGVVEIIPRDAFAPGILAGVSRIISNAGISVRQAVSDDPLFVEDARLVIITEKPIPARLLPKVRAVRGVKSVVIL